MKKKTKKKKILIFLICMIFGIIITGFILFSFSAVPQFPEPEIPERPTIQKNIL